MKRIKNGFTLVEMLVVVAIIGIISAVALPIYQEHLDNARRGQAKAALVAFATAMERQYAESGSYATEADDSTAVTASSVFHTVLPQGATGSDVDYSISITASTDETYTLQAEAVNVMSGDGDFTINNTGAKTWGGNSCWEKSC
jgi:type IV pilus assembly protein PilE